ncbi:MAG: transposase [Burkholderia sp.]
MGHRRDTSRNTMAASVIRIGQAAQLVLNLMRDVLLDSGVTQSDETNLQALKERRVERRNRKARRGCR